MIVRKFRFMCSALMVNEIVLPFGGHFHASCWTYQIEPEVHSIHTDILVYQIMYVHVCFLLLTCMHLTADYMLHDFGGCGNSELY